MARFKYKGEKARPGFVKKYGDLKLIRVPKQDGTWLELRPGPSGKFPPGQDIGHDVTDPRAVRCLEADSRYERIS